MNTQAVRHSVSAQRFQQMLEISKLMVSTLDFDTVLILIMRKIRDMFHAEVSSLLLVDKSTGELVFHVALGPAGPHLKKYRLKPGQGIAGAVALSQEPVIVENTAEDQRHFKDMDIRTNFTTKSMMVAPLVLRDETIGVVEVINPLESPFTSEDLDLLVMMMSFAAIAIENARYSTNLEQMVRGRTRELERANKRLREIDTAKSEFLSSAAHELKTPLGAIKTFLILLKDGKLGPVNDAQVEVLNDCVASVNRLLRLIKDLLRLARLEAGISPISVQKVPVRETVEETVRLLKVKADDKQITVTRSIEDGFVRADPDKLAQVLVNIIGNAIKYTPGGGEVCIEVRKENGKWRFSVSDTGPGMTREEIEKLFVRFQRLNTEQNRNISGTGLGLAISKKLIEMQNGEIHVRSEPGKGSVFEFLLPVWADESVGGSNAPSSERRGVED